MTGDGLVAFNQASGLAGNPARPRPRGRAPEPVRRREDVHVPAATGHPLLEWRARQGLGRPLDVRARLQARDTRSVLLRRHRRRGRLREGPEALQPLARDRHGRRRADRHLPSRRARPGFPLQAGSPRPRTSCLRVRRRTTPACPATGPYMIQTYRPSKRHHARPQSALPRVVAAAQPDGYPDEIVFGIGGTTDSVDRRRDSVARPTSSARRTRRRRPPRAGWPHSGRATRARCTRTRSRATVALFLNTTDSAVRPPRRAQGAELRGRSRRGGRAAGGSDRRPGDLPDPAARVPGLPPVLPLHRGRVGDGRWTAPDLARARALIAASGTRGMKVTVWSWKPSSRYRGLRGEAAPVARLSRRR